MMVGVVIPLYLGHYNSTVYYWRSFPRASRSEVPSIKNRSQILKTRLVKCNEDERIKTYFQYPNIDICIRWTISSKSDFREQLLPFLDLDDLLRGHQSPVTSVCFLDACLPPRTSFSSNIESSSLALSAQPYVLDIMLVDSNGVQAGMLVMRLWDQA